MGPHPAVAAIRRAVRSSWRAGGTTGSAWADPARDRPTRVIVACSGGADSLALAAAVAFEAPRAGIAAALVTVDHGLQDGSAEQAGRVAALAYELGFDPVEIVPVTVGTAGGPEAAARDARYLALDAVADALDAPVLLGHTLDDQAETVLLGLGRGSGPRSIAGMQAVDGRYRRPLLGVRRAVTEAACTALGLVPWHDPHNDDRSYQRVRLRTEVLPLLEDVLQGGVAPALARTADLLRDDLAALDELAAAHLATAHPTAAHRDDDREERAERDRERDGERDAAGEPEPQTEPEPVLDVPMLAELPRALRTRLLRAWLGARPGARALTAVQLSALDGLVTDWHGQGPLQLPGGLRVRRASGRLVAYREAVPATAARRHPPTPPDDPPELPR